VGSGSPVKHTKHEWNNPGGVSSSHWNANRVICPWVRLLVVAQYRREAAYRWGQHLLNILNMSGTIPAGGKTLAQIPAGGPTLA